MAASTTHSSAQQLLDAVNRLDQVTRFDVPEFHTRFADEVASDADAGPDAIDTRIRAMLGAIDGFCRRVMRIRLDNALVDDHSVPAQFRTYLATQVLDYVDDLDQLRRRIAGVAARVDPVGASNTAAVVADAADDVFALRSQLRQGVLALVPEAPSDEPVEEPPSPDRFDLLELD